MIPLKESELSNEWKEGLLSVLFPSVSIRKRLHQDDSLDAASGVWKLAIVAGLALCRL